MSHALLLVCPLLGLYLQSLFAEAEQELRRGTKAWGGDAVFLLLPLPLLHPCRFKKSGSGLTALNTLVPAALLQIHWTLTGNTGLSLVLMKKCPSVLQGV